MAEQAEDLFQLSYDDDNVDDATTLARASKDEVCHQRWLRREAARTMPKPKKQWKPAKTRLKRNQKCSVFLDWLVKTFELEKRGRGYICMECGKLTAAALDSEEKKLTFTPSSSEFHVVDVAGGRGQISFYLAAFYSIPVSVIDPAAMNLLRFEQLYEKNQEKAMFTLRKERGEDAHIHQTATTLRNGFAITPKNDSIEPVSSPLTAANSSTSTIPSYLASFDPALAQPKRPLNWMPHLRHFQCLFPSSISISLHKNYDRPPKSTADSSSEDENIESDGDNDQSSHEDTCCSQSSLSTFQSSISSSSPSPSANLSPVESTLLTCSLLYGMHSDGATEALVDYSLAHGKDFAVVPCCVFPKSAPHRRVRRRDIKKLDHNKQQSELTSKASQQTNKNTAIDDGDEWVPVRTYEQFLCYLLAKDPSIQLVELDFEGRNTVLYRKMSSSLNNLRPTNESASESTQ